MKNENIKKKICSLKEIKGENHYKVVHNEAGKSQIAKVVIMPGDPLRAKFIAENFLEDYKLVNSVRNMLAYTGKYKGKRITVMSSGMGMPSMGIYAYELFKFYNVEYIIRTGSCGVYTEEINLLDIILVNRSYNEGNYAKNMTGEECHIIDSSKELNNIIEETAKKNDVKYFKSNIACTECFDPYLEDIEKYVKRLPKEENIVGSEMESFALLYVAKKLNKKASCILTVADSNVKKEKLTSKQREKSFNTMIKLALDSSVKLR